MPELDQARMLMESAERETDLERKLADLEEGLDLIDDYLGDHPDTTHTYAVAINMRRAHLRHLIAQLVEDRKLRVDDAFESWFGYIKLFIFRVPSVVDSILADDPDLKLRYQEFVGIWMPELLAAAERRLQHLRSP